MTKGAWVATVRLVDRAYGRRIPAGSLGRVAAGPGLGAEYVRVRFEDRAAMRWGRAPVNLRVEDVRTIDEPDPAEAGEAE